MAHFISDVSLFFRSLASDSHAGAADRSSHPSDYEKNPVSYKNLSGSRSSAVFKTPRNYPYWIIFPAVAQSPRLAFAPYRNSISNSFQARLFSNCLNIFSISRHNPASCGICALAAA
jgi:hypothetical protein